MNINVDINSCEECPYAKISKVYTADSFEDVRKVHCTLLNKDVHSYLEWRDSSPIPTECPAKI